MAAHYSIEGVAPRIEAALQDVSAQRHRPLFGFVTAMVRAAQRR